MREALAVIPARGGSKRVPRKNVAPIGPDRRPMIDYTLDAALDAKYIDHVVVTSDDDEVLTLANARDGVMTVRRPAILAEDDVSATKAVAHAIDVYASDSAEINAIVMLLPTSPLRTASHVDEAYHMWVNRDPVGSTVISVTGAHKEALRYEDSLGWLRRLYPPGFYGEDGEGTPPVYISNGAIQIAERKVFEIHGGFGAPKCLKYVMDPIHGLDVDEPEQLMLADAYLRVREEPWGG